jgi:ABC-type transporter MlaC component
MAWLWTEFAAAYLARAGLTRLARIRMLLRSHMLSLLVNAYTSVIESTVIDKVQYATLRQSASSAVISAEIPNVKGNKNQVKFRLTAKHGAWLVNDVMVESTSLVTVFRASFTNIVGKKGVTG